MSNLRNIEPQSVWHFFSEVCQVPSSIKTRGEND